jgi:hypothetical protein
MHTPVAALAWELWHKHRQRVMTSVGLVLGFAFLYPKLCALWEFNPDRADPFEDLARAFAQHIGPEASLRWVVGVLFLLFLAGGPILAMFLTLLQVVRMFSFCEFDPQTKDPMKFPERIFALPISTPFLFWFLWLGGMGTMAALHVCWVYFVRLPHSEAFEVYQNCFGWMTLLALTQGIAWALAAWPNTRMALLAALLFGFLFSPALRDTFRSPLLLPSLFILGFVLAFVGLRKIRHTQWQGWAWNWPFRPMRGRAELRGPKKFASPTEAQLWFEWRRSARRLCFIAAVLALLPILLLVLIRLAAGFGPLSNNTMNVLAVYLVALPMILHFMLGVSPARGDTAFLMQRPISNGKMMMAMLKAAAISSIIAWVVVAAALAAMPMLGDFGAVKKSVEIPPRCLFIVVPALLLLTWRFVAVSLGFVWSGHRNLEGMPVLMMVAFWAGAIALSVLSRDGSFWAPFLRFLPVLMASLILVKFLLALVAFRISLKRGLLSSSSVAGYLAVWTLLAGAFLILTAVLFHGSEWMLPFSLGVVLLTPLARIGFCPIALDWSRHK